MVRRERHPTPTSCTLPQHFIPSTPLGKIPPNPQFWGPCFPLKPFHATPAPALPTPQQLLCGHTASSLGNPSRIPAPTLQVEELQLSQSRFTLRAIHLQQSIPRRRAPTFLQLPGPPRHPQHRALPLGTRRRGWGPWRQRRQRAGCSRGNNSALSSVTFSSSTRGSARRLEEVRREGRRQKHFVFFQPGWSNSVSATLESRFQLRERSRWVTRRTG